RIRGSLMIALAKERSCFSPVESRSPPSPTSLSSPASRRVRISSAETVRRAERISSSVASGFP
ncbi:MAG: hypothetical protein IIY55_01815, partial [Blautia sp.]|nr:hypothetical protein [Blautia sp.]